MFGYTPTYQSKTKTCTQYMISLSGDRLVVECYTVANQIYLGIQAAPNSEIKQCLIGG